MIFEHERETVSNSLPFIYCSILEQIADQQHDCVNDFKIHIYVPPFDFDGVIIQRMCFESVLEMFLLCEYPLTFLVEK